MDNKELENKIVIYETEDGKTQLDVKLENETVWLTQGQMVTLFDSSKANVSEHIKHIYEDGELTEEATVRKFRTVRQEGSRQVTRTVTYYNLDLIISLGYRVNTKRGIAFRQWATTVLKAYLIRGYAINQRIREENYRQMVQLVRSMARTVKLQDLSKEVQNALLDVVVDYTFALDRLDDYDYQRLTIPESDTEEKFHADTVSSRSHTLIVFYDATVGKRKLLKAVKKLKGTILYDYKNFNGIAASFPQNANINSVMATLRKVKGVLSVEQDKVLQLDSI